MKFDKLDNAKLLSIILGSRTDVINEAMAPYNTVGEMINHFTEEDILNTKGLGQATINKLNALSELYDRIIQEDVIKNKILHSKLQFLPKDFKQFRVSKTSHHMLTHPRNLSCIPRIIIWCLQYKWFSL